VPEASGTDVRIAAAGVERDGSGSGMRVHRWVRAIAEPVDEQSDHALGAEAADPLWVESSQAALDERPDYSRRSALIRRFSYYPDNRYRCGERGDVEHLAPECGVLDGDGFLSRAESSRKFWRGRGH
jgi:hypothetical protein